MQTALVTVRRGTAFVVGLCLVLIGHAAAPVSTPARAATAQSAVGSDQAPADQSADPAETPIVFRAQTDLVVLHVNVFDRRSDAVPNLPQSAFLVIDEDKPQDISFFASGDVPVAVGLVIDNSSSMITRRAMVMAGTKAFAESSHEEDELFTVIFNENIRHGLPTGVSFTRSAPQIVSSLIRFPPGGKTALYDAVIAALEHLETATHQKRVLLVLSDGGDNASRRSKEDMFARVAESDAIIYTIIKPVDSVDPGDDPDVMKNLAERSGGLAYYPRTEDQVIANFGEVAANVRHGYSLGYVPTAEGDGYRRVKVMVRVPGRPNLTARVRHGYLPGRSQ
jgi:Ca-activated chloride channel family protein